MDTASHHSDVPFFAPRFEDGSNEHFELLLMVQSLQWQSMPNRGEIPELDAFMASHHLSWYQVKHKLDALLEACVDGEPQLDECNEDDDIVDVSFLDHVSVEFCPDKSLLVNILHSTIFAYVTSA
jgi:hypothetical protein